MSNPLTQRAIGGAACALLTCCLNMNSPDFPGGSDSGESLQQGGTDRWSVTDAESGQQLAAGCNNQPTISDVVPGQKLVVETRSASAIVAASNALRTPEAWCADRPELRGQARAEVSSLECWHATNPRSAARVLDMEVIPSPSKPLRDSSIRPNPDVVPGQGYRFTIEVLNAGPAYLEPSGQCENDAWGRPFFDTPKSVVVITCGAITPCASPAICTADRGCVVWRCDDDGPCPEQHVCVNSLCTPQYGNASTSRAAHSLQAQPNGRGRARPRRDSVHCVQSRSTLTRLGDMARSVKAPALRGVRTAEHRGLGRVVLVPTLGVRRRRMPERATARGCGFTRWRNLRFTEIE